MSVFWYPKSVLGTLVFVFLLAAVLVSLTLAFRLDDSLDDFGVNEDEYREILSAADSPDPTGDPSADCPFKLTRDQWATLQSQYERTPPVGDALVTGEHYILTSLLNQWKLYPKSAEEALRIAEFLLTYCLED